jgi:serine/threonine-protein kinase
VSGGPSYGRYRVVGELGRGAMGVVYRGVDPQLDRPVAIKVISARAGAVSVPVEELEARFLREAKVAARIAHPGVVTVFDAGRQGDSLFLVMELVEGESLAQRMARGVYPPRAEALELCARVADALTAAHALGVVHRDIKPANILITPGGQVKVSDFGVAKAIGEGSDLTRTGTVVGSPAYMPPEQVRGEAVDGRADLFSLGVVLYELLLRRKPFPADTITTLIYQILNNDPLADPQALRALGDEVGGFLRACLAKDPRQRTADAAAFAAQARSLAARLPAGVVETAGPTRVLPLAAAGPDRGAPRGRVPLLPVAIFGIGVVAVAVALLLLRRTPPPAGEVLLGGPVGASTAAAGADETAPPAVTPTAVATATATPRAPTPTVPPTVPPAAPIVVPPTEPPPPPTPTPTPTPPVEATFVCSSGAEFHVSPEEAEVALNGRVIGLADDWDDAGGGRTWMFEHPGTYYARLSAAGRRTAWVKIVVETGASEEICDVDFKLPKIKR